MSYTIVYEKHFLRINGNYTKNGITRYIPLILCGDNNVYEPSGKRVREWSVLFPQIKSLATESELLKETDHIPDDTECFKYKTKWLYGKDMKDFISYGIKHAKSIEELCMSSTGLTLLLYCIKPSNTGYGISTYDEYHARTTPEIIAWLNQHKNDTIRLQYSPKEFKLLTKPTTAQVVLKDRSNRYVYDYGHNENGDICRIALGELSKAKVFDSYDEAKEIANTFRDLRIVQYKNVTKNKPWRVLAGPDLFVKKLSSRHLWFTGEKEEARKFANQKEAENYINEKLVPRFGRNFKAINIQATTTGV